MKMVLLGIVLVGALAAGGFWLAKSSTKDNDVKLAQKVASDKEQLEAVERRDRNRISADEVIKLRDSGVSDKVIIEMIQKSKHQTRAVNTNTPASRTK